MSIVPSQTRTAPAAVPVPAGAGRPARVGGRGGGGPREEDAHVSVLSTRAADSSSRNSVAFGCRLRIDAGQAVVTGPSRAAPMAVRLAGPGPLAAAPRT